MAWIENKETPSTQVWARFRIKKIICASALAATTLFNSCWNDHTIKDLQNTTGIEKNDSTKNYWEVVDPIQVIKEGDDWKKYIDDIYHYPIIEKDWKQYLIYNNTEYKLENCQRINDNNQEFYIYSLKNGWDLYYLADDEIHKWEIISDMWKTTDWKIYFTITNLETQKETFVFNWKEVGKLDHISKVYWDRAEKLLFVFWNDYNEEWNITYKLITNNNEHKIDYPYELIDGEFFDENVSLEFYKECFTLMNQ